MFGNELQPVLGIHFLTELQEVDNTEKTNANENFFSFLFNFEE